MTTPKSWFSPLIKNAKLNEEEQLRNALPPANFIEFENNYVIDVAAPGFNKEDIKVEVEDCVITVSGKNKTTDITEENYTRKEFPQKSFERSFCLPEDANPGEVSAKFENGILKLMIAKVRTEELQKTNVEVK